MPLPRHVPLVDAMAAVEDRKWDMLRRRMLRGGIMSHFRLVWPLLRTESGTCCGGWELGGAAVWQKLEEPLRSLCAPDVHVTQLGSARM